MENSTRTLKIKHVADLLTMHFNIPCYQRGYRWEEKHVVALLDDILSFSKQIEDSNNKTGKFYCLQPLAVVENHILSEPNQIVYDVIDGQQRLTTLYLLLSYLSEIRKFAYPGTLGNTLFSLKYETRDSLFFEQNEFKNADIARAIANIDFFYMTRAYRAIESWFQSHNSDIMSILPVLIPKGYKETNGLIGEELEKAESENDKKNDVRFIWYEVPTQKYVDSMEVFSQLNYGKTPLTSTELAKALLFQCDLYNEGKDLMREIAFRRSCEWDTMEKQLQDPYMWAMLMSSKDQTASHLSLPLSLVCDDLYNTMKKNDPGLRIDDSAEDYIYQVCNAYLGTNKDGDYADNVKFVWDKVQTTYTAMYNWYKNPDCYHLIGLLIWLKENKSKAFNITSKREFIKELMTEYKKKPTDDFTDYLMKQIASIIKVPETKKDKDGNIMEWGIKHINYHDNASDLIRILVTFNVEQIRQQQDESARFPFHLLRDYNITSLEHIHPQNLVLDNIDLETLKDWLGVKEANLKQLDKYGDYAESIALLRSYLVDNDTYHTNKVNAISIINKIDKEFDDLAGMKESQMHTLYNMALVDKATNSALSNHLLDKKRSLLIEFANDGTTYVMPATRRAFSKYYTGFSDQNPLPKLWTRPDREAYFSAIEKVYNEYISKLNK
jgi:hypothetical protein